MKICLNLIIAGLLSVVSVGTGLSVVHQKEFSQDVLPFSNLTSEIISTKDEFLPLEPIPLILELNNRAKKPVSGHKGLVAHKRIITFGFVFRELVIQWRAITSRFSLTRWENSPSIEP